MQALEEYFTKRKKKDHMDEFDLNLHSENMSKAIQYVMDYFNEYLSIEEISQEQIKLQNAIDKIRDNIENVYPDQTEIIIEYYLKTKKRLDKIVEDAYNKYSYSSLIYSTAEERTIAKHVCEHILRDASLSIPEDTITKMIHRYRLLSIPDPRTAEMLDVDDSIRQWVYDTYSDYHVNLLMFAEEIADEYDSRYIETTFDRRNEHYYAYRIVKYEYRYEDNPFDINSIYEDNKDKPFIQERKGMLEMLIMHEWLFNCAHDEEYWPEYCLLCEQTGKASLTKKKRHLIPVQVKGVSYPEDVHPVIRYFETTDGLFNGEEGRKYILRINYNKADDSIWKEQEKLNSLVNNLRTSFTKYGHPVLLEFDSPYKGASLTEQEFFLQYIRFEKAMQRYSGLRIALVNGSTRSIKGKSSMYATAEDIIRLQTICRERKIKLKLAVNFSENRRKNDLGESIKEAMDTLVTFRRFIVAVHLNSLDGWSGYYSIYRNAKDDSSEFIYIDSRVKPLSEFLACFATIIQDNRPRFFIPSSVKSDRALEELTDYLFRAGCWFESEGGNE